jgi:hypothetical protein
VAVVVVRLELLVRAAQVAVARAVQQVLMELLAQLIQVAVAVAVVRAVLSGARAVQVL